MSMDSEITRRGNSESYFHFGSLLYVPYSIVSLRIRAGIMNNLKYIPPLMYVTAISTPHTHNAHQTADGMYCNAFP